MVPACVFSKSSQCRTGLVADLAHVPIVLHMFGLNMVKHIVSVLGGESTIMALPKDCWKTRNPAHLRENQGLDI